MTPPSPSPTRHPLRALLALALCGGGMICGTHGLPAAEAASAEFPKVFNTQVESIPMRPASEVASSMGLPDGFHATVFAAEPDVQQPIAITTDSRGRLWVAENYTYSENAVNYHPGLRDRIVILEDTDGDGRMDRRTVFWDQAQKLTGIVVGLGGVYALCPPNLLFLPDRNHDDVPDGPPQVLLDGWNDFVTRHTIVNGLKWGPDGWLYGRQGIQATSEVGIPGTPKAGRTPLNAALWRFHPATHVFEVVCQGTTNPWGHDWDEHGQLFFINTVIGHLWHAVPGAYFRRMYGDHFNPHLYELIEQTADHFHWDTREVWSEIRKIGVSEGTSEAGGGHAHAGLMIYLGDNWPAAYRNSVLTVNYHGKRLNRDILERRGAGYVAHHGPDFMTVNDPWFRGIDMLYGADGGVYLSDWSDIGECHDQDGIHRTSGRIYKITHGTPAPKLAADIARESDARLVALQLHANDWQVRQARLELQDRFQRGLPMESARTALRSQFATSTEPAKRLRSLWALHVTGGVGGRELLDLLGDASEHIRSWAVLLLTDSEAPSRALMDRFATLAASEPSGLVLTHLASVLGRAPVADRWGLAAALSHRRDFAADPTFPLLLWYGIQPGANGQPGEAVGLALASEVPKVQRFLVRYVSESWDTNQESIARILAWVGGQSSPAAQANVLGGMIDAMQGWRKATPPAGWSSLAARLGASPDAEVRRCANELSVLFGEGRATGPLRQLVTDPKTDIASRRKALQALVQSRADGMVPLLEKLLGERDLATDALRALAALGSPEAPGLILARYKDLGSPLVRGEALSALASRKAFAEPLISAVAAGRIPKGDVGALQVRQLRSLGDDDIRRRVAELWPELSAPNVDKDKAIARQRQRITQPGGPAPDPGRGRALFQQACGTCHRLFGEGGQVGPELTGSDRKNLGYLLDNLVDPSGIVPESYRASAVALKDGRVINGVVGSKVGRILSVQTAGEKLNLEQSEIESITPSQLSLMPEGLLDGLTDLQVRDLITYLMSDGGGR